MRQNAGVIDGRRAGCTNGLLVTEGQGMSGAHRIQGSALWTTALAAMVLVTPLGHCDDDGAGVSIMVTTTDGEKVIGYLAQGDIPVRTRYGLLQIKASSLESTDMATWRLRDGTSVRGELATPQLRIATGTGERSLPADRIRSIASSDRRTHNDADNRSVRPALPPFQEGRFALGINYPGVGIRYVVNPKYSVELKVQFEKDIRGAGLRLYRYFYRRPRLSTFAGAEAQIISFEGEVSKGNGFAGSLFVGGEWFFANKLSTQLDFGPAFVSLKDSATSLSVDGIEYVVNFGVNYYFGDN